MSSVSIVFYHGDSLRQDMINTDDWACNRLITMSLGYFLADSVDLYLSGNLELDMQIHHGVVAIAYGCCVAMGWCAPYLVATLTVETNNIFLHFRKLYLLAGASKDSVGYRVNLSFLLGTYPACRFIPHGLLLYSVVKDYDNFSEHRWVWYIAFMGMVVMNVMNIFLFRNICVADQTILKNKMRKAVSLLHDENVNKTC
eukprot:CFRG8281T1